ncbi:MAG: ABC transporter ATP-binding protein [Wenzhouxiangella sp.]|nr:ABC transporter ATP-binding protein [Wenzhouxiangella sp.]
MTEAVIELDKISLRYGQQLALDGVSAHACAGDIIGLVGRNGAGKSSLLETIAGLRLPGQGRVSVLGQDASQLDSRARQSLGLVFQDGELFDWMPVWRHLDFVASFYDNWQPEKVTELLRDWQVPTDRRVGDLSRGQRQMLAIASALGHDPAVLLLDEPVSALDPVARQDFLARLVELACDSARTIIFSTHLINDLERITNRIWLLSRGRLLIDEETDQLREQTCRLTVRSRRELPATLGLAGTLRERVNGRNAQLILKTVHSPDRGLLESQLDARVDIERLGLEALCLEYLS